jgi:hypothetical protein
MSKAAACCHAVALLCCLLLWVVGVNVPQKTQKCVAAAVVEAAGLPALPLGALNGTETVSDGTVL